MEQGNLNFNWSLDLRAFLRREGATKLDIVKNPRTGKNFFTTDGENPCQGGVSGKAGIDEILADGMISEVVGEAGDPFLLLHKRRTENVVKTFSL